MKLNLHDDECEHNEMGFELKGFCSMKTDCIVGILYDIHYRQPLVVDLLSLQLLLVVLLLLGHAASISLTVIIFSLS